MSAPCGQSALLFCGCSAGLSGLPPMDRKTRRPWHLSSRLSSVVGLQPLAELRHCCFPGQVYIHSQNWSRIESVACKRGRVVPPPIFGGAAAATREKKTTMTEQRAFQIPRRNRPTLGPSSACSRGKQQQNNADLGRCLPSSVQHLTSSAKIVPSLGRISANPLQIWPSAVQISPALAKSGRFQANFGQILASFALAARVRAHFRRGQSNSPQV